MLSFTVDRSSLSLADLAIDDEGFGAYAITPNGYEEPDVSPRVITARSRYVIGELATGYSLNTATLVLEVWVQATTTAILETRCDALKRAFTRQTKYLLTRTLDGQSRTFRCQPAGVTRVGPVRKGDVYAHQATYRIAIPVYPISGS